MTSLCSLKGPSRLGFYHGVPTTTRGWLPLKARPHVVLSSPRPALLLVKLCHQVDGRSSGIHAQSRLSAIAAALPSATPEENSTSFSSKESGLKLDLNLPRRRLQVSFTCDACGVRSHRLINPNAYARGTVFVQCAGCEVYHKLVDNLGLIEEYDFREETASKEAKGNMDVVE